MAELCVVAHAGGDWDKRNRLKVLKGLNCLVTRDFVGASSCFLGAVATFTSTEIFSYEKLAFYTHVLRERERETCRLGSLI